MKGMPMDDLCASLCNVVSKAAIFKYEKIY